MSHHHDTTVPRFVLWAAGAMLLVSVGLTAYGRQTNVGTVSMPPADAVQIADISFRDEPNGAVTALLEPSQRVLQTFEPATNAFMRGVLRGMVRERRLESIPGSPPFRLTKWSDGRLTIEDPQTTHKIDLGAFGTENAAVFAHLMEAI